jgi:RNA polymerase subunit RPABC4/transcription elongation factor Spt4
LKKQCNKCSELLEIDWEKCPYCWDEKKKKSKKNKKSSNI